MRSVTIGIYFDEDVRRLDATLLGLRAHTGLPHRVILLPDQGSEIPGRHDFPRLEGTVHGGAACFNRLAQCDRSDVIVFLEAGAVPGPQWLERLLTALNAEPQNGLAGPSTNLAWNEQNALRASGGNLASVVATARLAAAQFGPTWRELTPLYSLADFCYAVKREVIDAVGAADEQYGRGPCWEMDYNIRAARAGYRGVWVRAAYVYRPPFSARRSKEESRLLEANKRRYQDKFCGLRLNRSRTDYESHCRGGACEHFAPQGLIEIELPFPEAPHESIHAELNHAPLVSCLMPTRDRPDFVRQSIEYFLRQDYPSRELLILDDGREDLSSRFQVDPRVRYVRLAPGLSIGAKRNRGCDLAKGQFIAQWDDDDWYSPARLSLQLEPLRAGTAEISAFRTDLFFDLPHWKFWRVTPELHRRLFVEDVHGGTLVFKRSCWERLAKYPDCSLAEDAGFLRRAMQSGARLRRLENKGDFIYLRHGSNSWSFICGQQLDPAGWRAAEAWNFSSADLTFYAAHSANAPRNPDSSRTPLVSCIMPTFNRRRFVPQAIQYFLRQDYPNRELIIIDDGNDPVSDLVPQDSPHSSNIRYLRLTSRQSIGAKRNLACAEAAGNVIAHWDDDDWMADWRLSYQVNALVSAPGKSVCGLAGLLFFDPRRSQSWMYRYPERERRWVAGGTLCYYKQLWRQCRFSEIDSGEDTRFIWSVPEAAILELPNHEFCLGIVHERNTSPKRTQDPRWSPFPVTRIKSMVGGDFGFYENWSAQA